MSVMTMTATRWLTVGLLIAGISLLLCEPALATGAQGMPWETPMQKITRSLTGPVAMAISLLGVLVAGVSLIFGGEMGDFTRRLVMLVFVISMVVSASALLSALFNTSGLVL